MTSENTTPAPDPGAGGGLLDVSGIDLDDIAALPDSVLRSALRRVLAGRAALPDRFAAFQSSL
ncbi:FxSxx-COOH cyclophane-containing RiPP peptide [Actinokineospora sp. NPDC004072]